MVPAWFHETKALSAKYTVVMTTTGMRKGDLPDEELSGVGDVVTGIAPDRTKIMEAKVNMVMAFEYELYLSSGVSSGPMAETGSELLDLPWLACPAAPLGVDRMSNNRGKSSNGSDNTNRYPAEAYANQWDGLVGDDSASATSFAFLLLASMMIDCE